MDMEFVCSSPIYLFSWTFNISGINLSNLMITDDLG